MNVDPHQFFKSKEDFERWQPYILQCDHIAGFSTEQQGRAKRALEYLQIVFGQNFLKRAKQRRHHLLYLLMQATAMGRTPVVELGEALEALKDAENFKRIFKLLKADAQNRQAQDEQFSEGYSAIKIAYEFFKAGFTVCFIDDKGSGKRPDIKLVDNETGEEIFIEISALVRSDKVVQASRASDPIRDFSFYTLTSANLTMYADMKAGFDQSQAIAIVDQLRQLGEGAKVHAELKTLINEYIVAGIAPDDKLEQLDAWAMKVGISKDITGPLIIFNELARVMRKIREKVKQLPKDKLGIIYIPLLTSFLFHTQELQQILKEIEKQISGYPNLLAVVLSRGYAEEYFGNVIVENVTPSITIKIEESGTQGPIIILENQSLALDISSSVLTKFRRVFR